MTHFPNLAFKLRSFSRFEDELDDVRDSDDADDAAAEDDVEADEAKSDEEDEEEEDDDALAIGVAAGLFAAENANAGDLAASALPAAFAALPKEKESDEGASALALPLGASALAPTLKEKAASGAGAAAAAAAVGPPSVNPSLNPPALIFFSCGDHAGATGFASELEPNALTDFGLLLPANAANGFAPAGIAVARGLLRFLALMMRRPFKTWVGCVWCVWWGEEGSFS